MAIKYCSVLDCSVTCKCLWLWYLRANSDQYIHPQAESAVSCEMLPNKSTSCRYTAPPLRPLQFFDDSLPPRGHTSNRSERDVELDSFITSFVQNSLSQAKQMVGEVMQVCSKSSWQLSMQWGYHCVFNSICCRRVVAQAIPENSKKSREEGRCTSNQAAHQGDLGDGQLPSSLILNCVATVVAIKVKCPQIPSIMMIYG